MMISNFKGTIGDNISRFIRHHASCRSIWSRSEAFKHPFIALNLSKHVMKVSLSERNELHLGIEVLYEGEKYCITNGNNYVTHDGELKRLWTIRPCFVDLNQYRAPLKVFSDDLKICKTLPNMKYNALSKYTWWVINWSDIDISKVNLKEIPCSVTILGQDSPLFKKYENRLLQDS